MFYNIRSLGCSYITVNDTGDEAYKLLSALAELGVNLVAATAIPFGPNRTQLMVFPEDSALMASASGKAGIGLDGPHPALLVQGDDEIGVIAGLHEKLRDANVTAYASTGVADGRGGYGYIIYVRPEDHARTVAVLRA